jgi:phosphoribosylaminoimidazolecarboxamide formyltransferase/IMP cyclohydrolase
MIHVKDLPAPANHYPIRRALLSVFDKRGVVELGKALHRHGVELISTGGTSKALIEAGLPVTSVDSLTGYPEILGGRVKTLHPAVHGGLLSRRTDPEDQQELKDQQIGEIDLVVVNLYPFSQATASPDTTDAVAIENIDIGGPTMLRAAAKNFFFVAVACSPDSYTDIIAEMDASGGALSMATRRKLAAAAFDHTAVYDTAVSAYFQRGADAAPRFSVDLPLQQTLRYGENPHQQAGLYGDSSAQFEKLHGKDLSFNNLLDLSAALTLIDEFRHAGPTVCILKHTNPCGVGTANTLEEAYHKAFSTDRQSPFGGIVVVNRTLDLATAQVVDGVFTEIIIAPDYADGVLDFLQQKQNRRLIRMLQPASSDRTPDVRSVVGGYLVQDRDPVLPSYEELKARCTVVTKRQPTDAEWKNLDFAWRVAKNVKSNAIVYAKDGQTIGVGAGQMSRIDASEIAVSKGRKSELDFSGCVIASDAFFPFADGLLEAAANGATAAIQPGGSVRDEEVIAAADENGIAMVFTGHRHFRH